MKFLVRLFTVLLIIFSLYQLSYRYFVSRHESKMEEKAAAWVKANYPNANSEEKESLIAERKRRLLDSTKDDIIMYGIEGKVSYIEGKEKQLNLGLDLQGGMNVTMEVGLEGLIKALAAYSKDPSFNTALQKATAAKANSDADYITLFIQEYKKLNPAGSLAALFANSKNTSLKITSSDAEVEAFLRKQADDAISNTYRVLQKRIDQFGVAQPNINLDKAKGIVTVELAGINDPERVRKFLQSTANLQFWELYNVAELDNSLSNADKKMSDLLKGLKVSADTTQKKDSNATAAAKTDANGKSLSELLSNDSSKAGKTAGNVVSNPRPITSLIMFSQPARDANNKTVFPAELGYVKLKDTGTLNSYLNDEVIKSEFPGNVKFVYGVAVKNKDKKIDALPIYALKTIDGTEKAKLEGEHIIDSKQDFDEKGRPSIVMTMDNEGSNIWAEMTGKNINKPIAIVLDNIVYSAPNVINQITGGVSSITGQFTIEEAQDLANVLKSGKLSAPAKIVQEQVVGPTLGKEAIKGGTMSFIISFLVIFVLMLIYYNTAGWVANIALILNLLFTVGILSALGGTLTAAGIAGLVLTIGMAVDTNVIIFERIKEELARGRNYHSAVEEGYKRSLPPVIDSHVTGLLTAIILFIFGLGPVLGFATTQIIGILLSLFSGIIVSRIITDWYTKKQRHFEYFTSLSRKIFKHANFHFIEWRKYAYIISGIVLVLGIGSFFNGFKMGVEFEGGRSYTVKFAEKIKNEDLINSIHNVIGEYPTVKTMGTDNSYNITTAYMINVPGQQVDSIVEHKIYEGVAKFLPQGTTYESFKANYKKGSQKVLPTISDDLKKGAFKATIFSIFIIFVYILLRFRKWQYSMGTIFALLHDVLVTLAVFSFFKNIVPFPLEIDQHFIAAILTVIGFSMNDTVIVFDRIREYFRSMKTETKEQVINKAINDTLSRTIMTSLTVFLTILILFIFGGEVTRGFAFAMLIGVITGTYSSIFVAAPILVDLDKHNELGAHEVSEHEAAKARAKQA